MWSLFNEVSLNKIPIICRTADYFFNLLVPGNFKWNFRYAIFKMDFSDWWLRHLLWNFPNLNVTGLHWWSVNIGSSNGLVPSGNKPLPEPMLTHISVTTWHQKATIMCWINFFERKYLNFHWNFIEVWMKTFEMPIKFHRSLFLSQHCFM